MRRFHFILLGISVALTGCSESFSDYANSPLKDVLGFSLNKRHEIVESFIDDRNLDDQSKDGIYSCLSEMLHTKSNKLALQEVLGWCENDYRSDPNSLKDYVNFDNFEKQFSPWDGSFRPLEKLIKNSMHDDSSYEHVSTKYRLILTGTPRASVVTEFRGKNSFGGTVKQSVRAAVSIESGEILHLIE